MGGYLFVEESSPIEGFNVVATVGTLCRFLTF